MHTTTRTDQPPTADGYVLGRSDAETHRLFLQHEIYGPLTRELFTAAGLTAGMKVLDLGAGAGDVALLLAELVGPQGRVVGVDVNPDILRTAEARARRGGWSNVVFEHGDVVEANVAEFDAVVGRWLLMYLDDPALRLRRMVNRMQPGTIVAFLEGVFRNVPDGYPPLALQRQVTRWMTLPEGAPGPDAEMGLKLFQTFLRAGLPAPQLRLGAPIGGGPEWPGGAYLAATLRSLLPFLEQIGTVTAEDVGIETLAARLQAEMVEHDGIKILPPLIGAWSRVGV